MSDDKPTVMDYFKAIFFHVPEGVETIVIIGRALAYIIIFVWGWTFIAHSVESNYVAMSFMHNINLVFHEAGHWIFGIFGRFMAILGGTLGQLTMPLVVIVAFLLQNRDAFGASVGLWWLGQSFMDIAPYINDATAMELLLLTGGTGKETGGHDWNNLLYDLGLLHWDHGLAGASHYFGIFLILTSYAWGGYMLFRQYQHREAFPDV